ncbi:MAG: hypothetical protein AAGD06_09850 [Acidobacteriota bacterium]
MPPQHDDDALRPAAWFGPWKQDRDVPVETPPELRLPWHDVFVCHRDGSVSLHLLSISLDPSAPADGVHRVEAHWRGDTLVYRAPNDAEVDLAQFRGGHFQMEGDGLRRHYRRIDPAELPESQRPLLEANRPISGDESGGGGT